MAVQDGEYWTSGTDLDCPGKYFWCSSGMSFNNLNIPWIDGHPDSSAGDCVYVNIKNSSSNRTAVGTGDCSLAKHFVCETRYKGTELQGMTTECMELWDVKQGKILVVSITD
jgi:hypothetical protein